MSALTVRALRGMLRVDGLRIARDRFIIGMAVYIIAVSIALRWVLPWLSVELDARFEMDFARYHPLAVSHVVVQLAPLLGGIIGGFLLLEGREERTVRALLVAPVPLTSYLAVLGAVLTLASAALTLVEAPIIGIGLPPMSGLAAAAFAGAPAAIIFALFIGAFAENKTQAFAFMKIIGLLPVIATAAYFVPEPFQWLFAAYPPYCASKAYWVAEAGGRSAPLWALGAWMGSAIYVVVLRRLFLAAMRR